MLFTLSWTLVAIPGSFIYLIDSLLHLIELSCLLQWWLILLLKTVFSRCPAFLYAVFLIHLICAPSLTHYVEAKLFSEVVVIVC